MKPTTPTSPKPNAPNTLAWTRPLDAPAPKPTKAPRLNPWTAPLSQVLAPKGGR